MEKSPEYGRRGGVTGTKHVEGETIQFKFKFLKKIISKGRKGFRMETNEQKVERLCVYSTMFCRFEPSHVNIFAQF